MHEPTPNDTRAPASVWFEVAAVEIEVGTAGHIVKLPPTGPGVLEPWQVCDTHPGQKNIGGKPRSILTVCFARQVAAGEPVQQAPQRIVARPAAPPPPSPARAPLGRRMQPQAAAPRVPEVTPSGVASAVESTVAGVVQTVAGTVAQTVDTVLSGLGLTPTPPPVNIPEGQGCACPVPVPAVENSAAAAVPCRGCGGWISNAQPAEQPTA